MVRETVVHSLHLEKKLWNDALYLYWGIIFLCPLVDPKQRGKYQDIANFFSKSDVSKGGGEK